MFLFRTEYMAYAPARCVEKPGQPDAHKNAVKALENLPLTGSKHMLQRAIMDCKRCGSQVSAIKEAIPRGARMAHFEDAGADEEAFAENFEIGRQFFIHLQLKYEAINARHEGSHAFLAEEVRHVVTICS